MGLSKAVQATSAGPSHIDGRTSKAQLANAKLPAPPAQMATRQCGRCRRFFAVDASAVEQPKWWACPSCHRRLLGSE